MENKPKIVCVFDNPGFADPIKYTFDILLYHATEQYKVVTQTELDSPFEYEQDTLFISYGKLKPAGLNNHIHIYSSEFFGKEYLTPASMPKLPLSRYNDIPIIYAGADNIEGYVKNSKKSIETNIDIVASSFFMLTRYEEVIIDTKDKHARFPASASVAYKERFLEISIVNVYIELLWSWINVLRPDIKPRNIWPEGKQFAVCLTHDVDTIRKFSLLPPVLSIGAALIKHRDAKKAFRLALDYCLCLLRIKKDPYETFDYITKFEQSLGFSSTFYFMAGGNNAHDGRSHIQKNSVLKLAQSLNEQGFEIGLHASYDSFNNQIIMNKETQKIQKALRNDNLGCRQHYLRWETPATWLVQESAGLLYDTTLTYADHAGFRCGFCLPFKPFDVINNRIINIWEIPLTVMDGSLQNPDYQNFTPEKAFQKMVSLLETVKRYNGVFTLLWHNSSLDDAYEWRGWKDIFARFISYAKENGAYQTTCDDIIKQIGTIVC